MEHTTFFPKWLFPIMTKFTQTFRMPLERLVNFALETAVLLRFVHRTHTVHSRKKYPPRNQHFLGTGNFNFWVGICFCCALWLSYLTNRSKIAVFNWKLTNHYDGILKMCLTSVIIWNIHSGKKSGMFQWIEELFFRCHFFNRHGSHCFGAMAMEP